MSVTSVYNKLNSLESGVAAALVTHTADRLAPVIAAMGGEMPALLPGYRARILDGNHFAATERRLDVLKQSKAGPRARSAPTSNRYSGAARQFAGPPHLLRRSSKAGARRHEAALKVASSRNPQRMRQSTVPRT